MKGNHSTRYANNFSRTNRFNGDHFEGNKGLESERCSPDHLFIIAVSHCHGMMMLSGVMGESEEINRNNFTQKFGVILGLESKRCDDISSIIPVFHCHGMILLSCEMRQNVRMIKTFSKFQGIMKQKLVRK